MNMIEFLGNRVIVQAGYSVPWLNFVLSSRGLTGIEHTVGIPGTIGGLVYMNGGSNRLAIGDNVKSIELVDRSGEIQIIKNKDCKFDYRSSKMQSDASIITKIELKLNHTSPKEIKAKQLSILRSRRKKFPLNFPTCGSVFKSSSEMYKKIGPPGKIIEDLGFKGRKIGGIQVSTCHANFFENRGGANSKDVIKLVKDVMLSVKLNHDFIFETEVKYLNYSGKIIPLSDFILKNNFEFH